MNIHELDQSKKDEFSTRAIDILNKASIAVMMSVGHRTGLFEVMAGLPPSTSEQIALAAGLKERYVREWLGAMVTGRIVDYDSEHATYYLPPEHAAFLTKAGLTNNIACFAQLIPLFCGVEDEIVGSFRNGGGVAYSSYRRFPEVMRELSSPTFDILLVDKILALAPRLTDSLQRGIDVLDVGCGSGHSTNVMARAFPKSRFVGYDFIEEQIAAASAEAMEWQLSNVRFAVKDVAMLDEAAQYDLVTAFDSVHDQAQPTVLLERISTALRPVGTFVMWDVAASSRLEKNLDNPLGPFLYTCSCMHCMTVSLAQNGEGLGAVWGEEKARAMLATAGLSVIGMYQLPDDPVNGCYIAKKQ
jgi:2-polyprenyl-3-methyl-5-hydroxy-6-metoxy-1,4-benzoquinol methylase